MKKAILLIFIVFILLGCYSSTKIQQPIKNIEAEIKANEIQAKGKKEYQELNPDVQKDFIKKQKKLLTEKLLIESNKITGEQVMEYALSDNNVESKKQNILLPQKIFRSTPIENLSEEDVRDIILRYNFFCTGNRNTKWRNISGRDFINDFTIEKYGRVVIDRASGLMWQREGSDLFKTYTDAQKYIDALNETKFAYYSDWRLPTLEEAMTLVENEKQNPLLYIDPLFGTSIWTIWTADKFDTNQAWVVLFNNASCQHFNKTDLNGWVRAVR